MSFEIKFSPKAQSTFDDLVTQLEQRWGTKFVNKFKDKLSKALDLISETPDIYHLTRKSDIKKMYSS